MIKSIKINNLLEVTIGAVILAFAIFFSSVLLDSEEKTSVETYHVYAEFGNINGVVKGTDVKISGIKIGHVVAKVLDVETYRAKTQIQIENKIKLPIDSIIKIKNSGLLGEKYLEIVPGIEDKILEEGQEINFTQDAFSIEDMVGKFLFKE